MRVFPLLSGPLLTGSSVLVSFKDNAANIQNICWNWREKTCGLGPDRMTVQNRRAARISSLFLLRVSFSELTAQRFTPRVYGEFQKSFPAKNNGGGEHKGHAEIPLPWSFLGKTLQKPLKFSYFSKMLLTVIKRLCNLLQMMSPRSTPPWLFLV